MKRSRRSRWSDPRVHDAPIPAFTMVRNPQAALARVGLGRIRLHDLRHQCVAAFLMAGGSIYDASKNLGHSSVAFTAAVHRATCQAIIG